MHCLRRSIGSHGMLHAKTRFVSIIRAKLGTEVLTFC
jgi:hypothetical protein